MIWPPPLNSKHCNNSGGNPMLLNTKRTNLPNAATWPRCASVSTARHSPSKHGSAMDTVSGKSRSSPHTCPSSRRQRSHDVARLSSLICCSICTRAIGQSDGDLPGPRPSELSACTSLRHADKRHGPPHSSNLSRRALSKAEP